MIDGYLLEAFGPEPLEAITPDMGQAPELTGIDMSHAQKVIDGL